MPKLRVDFSQSKEFDAIPTGSYPAVLDETEVKDGNEYPYVNWTFKIVAGEYTGRKQWLMTSTSPKAAWGLRAALRALGETNPDLDGDDFDVDPDDYLGREAIINVIQETYQNRLQNKIESLTAMPMAAGMSSGSGRRLS